MHTISIAQDVILDINPAGSTSLAPSYMKLQDDIGDDNSRRQYKTTNTISHYRTLPSETLEKTTNQHKAKMREFNCRNILSVILLETCAMALKRKHVMHLNGYMSRDDTPEPLDHILQHLFNCYRRKVRKQKTKDA